MARRCTKTRVENCPNTDHAPPIYLSRIPENMMQHSHVLAMVSPTCSRKHCPQGLGITEISQSTDFFLDLT